MTADRPARGPSGRVRVERRPGAVEAVPRGLLHAGDL